ncbi:CD99 antigen-like [Alca torda]
MGKFRIILLLCLGFLLVHVRGQRDFDLADALDHPEDIITRKPTVIRRPTRPVLNNDLHLGDALGGGDIPRQPLYPPLPPRPGSYSNSGGFDDSDLIDGKPLPPHVTGEEEHYFNHGGNTDSGLIAGVTSPIISAFVILVVGSIAAYSAYKNKKLCFKPHENLPLMNVLLRHCNPTLFYPMSLSHLELYVIKDMLKTSRDGIELSDLDS